MHRRRAAVADRAAKDVPGPVPGTRITEAYARLLARDAYFWAWPMPVERANWLPSPKNAELSLYVRAYWPEDAITRGQWTPPAVVKVR